MVFFNEKSDYQMMCLNILFFSRKVILKLKNVKGKNVMKGANKYDAYEKIKRETPGAIFSQTLTCNSLLYMNHDV